MHDGLKTAPSILTALPSVFTTLRAKGYCPGPVPATVPDPWHPSAAVDGQNDYGLK
jgi:hypothetical protein